MRTTYRCRAYPDEAQQQMLARTFGCVRVVWNRTLAARRARWQAERKGTSYAESDRALTAMKKNPGLAFLNEVSSVPLQQALRHQHAAFQAFFACRSCYPRFKSRHGRQSATYTRSAFRMRAGELWLAKTAAPLRFVWTWSGMIRNRKLARAISCTGWSRFRSMLEYKAERYGRKAVIIDRWYPSSKTCSTCGLLLASLSLGTRAWACPACGTRHDRDINAAKNILAAGLAADACGADVRHGGATPVQSAVKQEPLGASPGIPVP